MDKEIILTILGIFLGFIILITIIFVPVIGLNGWAYKDVCQEQGINNTWRCGLVAPNFGQKIIIDY